MISECVNCEKTIITDLTDRTIVKNEEFDQWETFNVECSCGSIEMFNMNIPENDTDEPFSSETEDLPVEEEVQRHYVRILQRLVRSDFK